MWAVRTFSVDLAICKAVLAQIEITPQEEAYYEADTISVAKLLKVFFHHAELLKTTGLKKARNLLAEHLAGILGTTPLLSESQ